MEIKKEVKELDASNIQLDVIVSKKDVKETYNKTVADYAKKIQIPGFRKGKAPISVLENRFGESLRMEVGADILEKALTEIFKDAEKDIKPLNYEQPELVSEIKLDPESDFSFSVKYDVYPKFELKTTESFTIKVPEVFGNDDALEDELKNIQRNNSFVVERKDGELAEKGDIVTIDYCELDANGGEVDASKRQDFTFEIGTEKNLYKIDDEIIGMKKGEEKSIKKTFPDDYEYEDLAGKTLDIKVKLTALKFRDMPPIDDDLAQDVSEKYKTLDELKTDLKDKIDKSVQTIVKNLKIDSYLNAVVEENDFILPQSMVQADLNLRWANMARQMGLSVEKLDDLMSKGGESTKENFFTTTRQASEKELKKRLIINALLDKNPEIVASDTDFENKYAEIAKESGQDLEEIKKNYDNEEYKQYLTDFIREEKLFDQYIAKCKVETEEKITATELLKRHGR